MKYKIFISANQKELHKERFVIKEVIMRGLARVGVASSRYTFHLLTGREILGMK